MRLYKRLILVILLIILEISCTDRSDGHCKPLLNTRIEVALHISYDACVGISYNECYLKAIDLISDCNNVFEPISWGVKGEAANLDCLSGIGFWLKQLLIHRRPSEDPGHYNFATSSRSNISDLLDSFSRRVNSSDVGFSLLLTGRNIMNDTLGQAHTGIPFKSGLYFSTPNNGKFNNTAVITTKYNGAFITKDHFKAIALHEIGHIMCALHDSKNMRKFFNESYFIMHGEHSVLSSYVPTSYSSDSKRSMYKSIVVAADKFVPPEQPSVCGNGVKEADEECDPGFLRGNKCCTKNCRLVPGAECSWNQDCCRHNCTFARKGDPCQRQLNEKTTGYCKGSSDRCEIVHIPETVTHHTVSDCYYIFEYIVGGCILNSTEIIFAVTTAGGFCAGMLALLYFVLRSKNLQTASKEDGFSLNDMTSCIPSQNAYEKITDDAYGDITNSTKLLPPS